MSAALRIRQPERRPFDPLDVPRSLEFEVMVLGSMILDPSVIDRVRELVAANQFYTDDHQAVARLIFKRREAGATIDGPLMTEDLIALGWTEDRTRDFVVEAMIAGQATHTAPEYADFIASKAMLRDLIAASHETIREAYSHEFSGPDAIGRAANRFLSISTDHRAGKPRLAHAVLQDAIERIHSQQDGAVFGVPTGFDDLDDSLGGCLPDGTLTIVAARPSMGKSAFAMNLCENASLEHNEASLFISLEMSDVSLGSRMLSTASGLNSAEFRTEKALSRDDLARLDIAYQKLKNAPIAILDQSGLDMAQIASVVRADVAERGTRLVVIDYLGMVGGSGDEDDQDHSRQERVAAMAKAAKRIANQCRIPVVLACQLNRLCVGRADKRPMLTDLRESGEIEQTADIVLLLHRPEYYDKNDSVGIAEVNIAKWREGKTGDVRLAFDATITQFSNLPEAPIQYEDDEPF